MLVFFYLRNELKRIIVLLGNYFNVKTLNTTQYSFYKFIGTMTKLKYHLLFSVFLFTLFISACKKDKEIVVPDNNAPYYDGIPKVVLQNYINRLFIDLIGREALDTEMETEENYLRANNLSISARAFLIHKLQTDTTYIVGDSSYKQAYYNRFYELCKARVIEAASNDVIYEQIGPLEYQATLDSISGDSLLMALSKQKVYNLKQIIACEKDYLRDSIEIKDVFARMLNNAVYDQINMNTFNFLNASFNDLFFRFPTSNEFNAGFNMVEYNTADVLFGKSASHKGEYLQILVNSEEFYEGIIRWMYNNLIARDPSTQEVYNLMQTFLNDHDVQKVQLHIMQSDEYANFN